MYSDELVLLFEGTIAPIALSHSDKVHQPSDGLMVSKHSQAALLKTYPPSLREPVQFKSCKNCSYYKTVTKKPNVHFFSEKLQNSREQIFELASLILFYYHWFCFFLILLSYAILKICIICSNFIENLKFSWMQFHDLFCDNIAFLWHEELERCFNEHR